MFSWSTFTLIVFTISYCYCRFVQKTPWAKNATQGQHIITKRGFQNRMFRKTLTFDQTEPYFENNDDYIYFDSCPVKMTYHFNIYSVDLLKIMLIIFSLTDRIYYNYYKHFHKSRPRSSKCLLVYSWYCIFSF